MIQGELSIPDRANYVSRKRKIHSKAAAEARWKKKKFIESEPLGDITNIEMLPAMQGQESWISITYLQP